MTNNEGLLWQGLNVDQAAKAFERRFGCLPTIYMAHTGDELTGAAVQVTYAKSITPGCIFMPLDAHDTMDLGD